MSEELRAALAVALADVRGRDVAPAVRRLIAGYRSTETPQAPILDDADAVTAYAAYRMPGTYAALREAFAHAGHLEPRTMLDLGGGTGAAAWAAAGAFPSLETLTVTDRSDAALGLGRRLARTSTASVLRSAQWRSQTLGPATVVEPADLVTAAYLLGELDLPSRDRLVRQISRAANAAVVVEPGTPAGYGRVLLARDALIDAGFSVLAPCPHSMGCPLAGGPDWCHFAARLDRSVLHRQAKGAELGYEDEKFAYVVAVRGSAVEPALGRVLRHPVTRKGLVTLTVCTRDHGVVRTPVAKSRPLYRAARDARWGNAWPPAGALP